MGCGQGPESFRMELDQVLHSKMVTPGGQKDRNVKWHDRDGYRTGVGKMWRSKRSQSSSSAQGGSSPQGTVWETMGENAGKRRQEG